MSPRGNENDLAATPAPPPVQANRRARSGSNQDVPAQIGRTFIEATVEFVRFPRHQVQAPTFMIIQGIDHLTHDPVAIKGTMAVSAGDLIRAEGSFKYESQYGWSFHASRVDTSTPADRTQVMEWLEQHGIELSEAHVGRIAAAWEDQAALKLAQDPYAVYDLGIDFGTVDRLGLAAGKDRLDRGRMRVLASHAQSLVQDDGDCRTTQDALMRSMLELGNAGHDQMASRAALNGINELVKSGSLTLINDDDQTYVYTTGTYKLEQRTARLINKILARPGVDIPVPKVRSRGKFRLTREQRAAVDMACTRPISCVTGGPGVGKTATLLAICEALDKMGHSYALAAPTGKAAKRMTESTGHPAETLHRLLGWKYVIGEEPNPEPLGVDVVIVDETSMLDLNMAERLLSRIDENTRIVLVGDVDQLPSVSMGSVLRDVIDSGQVPTARLTKTFRQGAGSLTLINAQRIRDGKEPFWTVKQAEQELDEKVREDFTFIEMNRPASVAKRAQEIAAEQEGVMLLAPSRMGRAGVYALNNAIQSERNPAGDPICQTEAYELRVGDEVLITRNDYKLGVVNGDMGRIIASRQDHALVDIEVDGRIVTMGAPQAQHVVELGYALTVHKSQGSQAPHVVCPLGTDAADRMLSKNLLYTAYTRGQKHCTVIGPKDAVIKALGVDGTLRATGLAKAIAAGS